MHTPMTDADLRHLENVNAPISDEERAQAAAEIRDLRESHGGLVDQVTYYRNDLMRHLEQGARAARAARATAPVPIIPMEWIAAFFGVLGAALLASAIPPAWGFASFLVSNGFWIAYSSRGRLKGLLFQQIAFTLTSVAGLWNWWLGPLVLG